MEGGGENFGLQCKSYGPWRECPGSSPSCPAFALRIGDAWRPAVVRGPVEAPPCHLQRRYQEGAAHYRAYLFWSGRRNGRGGSKAGHSCPFSFRSQKTKGCAVHHFFVPDYVLLFSDMERFVSTMTLSDVRSASFVALKRVERHFAEWRHCPLSRRELMTLSDRDSSDIGNP